MTTAFEVLGEVASNGFIANPNVERSIGEFVEYVDFDKLDYLDE